MVEQLGEMIERAKREARLASTWSWFALVLSIIALSFSLCLLLAGCSKDGNPRDVMEYLERGKATGHLDLSWGGSPLSAGMKQVFFLGPENASGSFSGAIDFSAPLLREADTNG